MRSQLILPIIVLVIFMALGWFVWSLIRSIIWAWAERVLARETKQMVAESTVRQQEREEQALKRFDNGCQHDFDDLLAAFPPNVCVKCGLTRKAPDGPCDHVWRREPGGIPASRCQKCDERYVNVAWHDASP